MNLSDIEYLEREVKGLRLDPAVAYAIMRIQHDLSIMLQKIDRIDAALAAQPRENWHEEDEQDEPLGPPF
jgi:hypothetical protein